MTPGEVLLAGNSRPVFLPPSLDNNSTSTRWTKAQKRAYARILMGLKRHRGEQLRFLTLTTPEKPKRKLLDAWKALKLRIKRLTPEKLEKEGYISKKQRVRYYGVKKTIEFSYFCVWTGEGQHGVLHILYFGDYIPQAWLSDTWNELIGAKIVDIRAVKSKKIYNAKRLAAYCVAQYCAGQRYYLHFSCSYDWCFRGFVGVFREFVSEYGFERAKKYMNYLLLHGRIKINDEVIEILLNRVIRKRIVESSLVEVGWGG